MRHFIMSAVAALLVGVASGAEARAVEVAVGDGIVVIDLTKDESRKILEAVDSAAAFAELVSPALPGEYHAALRLAAGGWRMLRMVLAEPVPVRMVLTAVPPAVLVLPATGATAEEVIRTYSCLRENAAAHARSLLAPALEARAPADQLQRWIEARLNREPMTGKPGPIRP
jgi:hypothetical protein